jgi:acyl-coenzyme A synthetase/AMP-(fatty) acid ligase
VYFRSELPKTNVGKILRRALRDELRESSGASRHTSGASRHN